MRRSEFSQLQASQGEVVHYKLCMAGCPAVGKTKLLTRYKYGSYSDSSTMTLLVDHIPMKKTVEGKDCVFDYYDTAGQEKYMSTVQLYLRNTHACVFVYDVTAPSTLDRLDEFIRIVQEIAPQSIRIIVGNKSDLEDSCNDAALEKYRAKGIKCYKASAKSGLHVQQLFQDLEKQVVKECIPSSNKAESSKLHPKTLPKAKEGNCC